MHVLEIQMLERWKLDRMESGRMKNISRAGNPGELPYRLSYISHSKSGLTGLHCTTRSWKGSAEEEGQSHIGWRRDFIVPHRLCLPGRMLCHSSPAIGQEIARSCRSPKERPRLSVSCRLMLSSQEDSRPLGMLVRRRLANFQDLGKQGNFLLAYSPFDT